MPLTTPTTGRGEQTQAPRNHQSPFGQLNVQTPNSLLLSNAAHTAESVPECTGPGRSFLNPNPIHPQSDTDAFAPLILGADVSSPSARFYNTARDIYLVTTLDLFGSVSLPRSFAYFINEVDCPFLSPFDAFNWKWMKLYLTDLASQNENVATALSTMQSIYRVVVNGLPSTDAVSDYQNAINMLQAMVTDENTSFDTVLAVAFLLCLCQVTLPNVDGRPFTGFDEAFETRFQIWLWGLQSPVSARLCVWLQLLHVAAKRVGSCGLVPETIFTLISSNIVLVPNLSTVDRYAKSANVMYEAISAPLFSFYVQLQRIGNQIQGLSHYRRSRTTPEDQAEVSETAGHLKIQMLALWDSRPGPLRLHPSKLRQDLKEAMAVPLITLAGLCIAAYFCEVVQLRRILGDRPFPSAESAPALRQIRNVVDGEWNATLDGLNPGYMRPLFLYAIERVEPHETQWAVTRMTQVKTPMSRSQFVSSLAEALGEAQRTEQRRVTTKYFCYQAFKVPVPLI